MVGLDIAFRIAPKKVEEFHQTVLPLVETRSRRLGALLVRVHRDITSPNGFLWIERWEDRERIDRGTESRDLQVLFGAIEVLGELEHVHRVRGESVEGPVFPMRREQLSIEGSRSEEES